MGVWDMIGWERGGKEIRGGYSLDIEGRDKRGWGGMAKRIWL